MTGWYRFIYKVIGWDYPEKACEKQIRLRHLLHEQIRKTSNIKCILKPKQQKQKKKKNKKKQH